MELPSSVFVLRNFISAPLILDLRRPVQHPPLLRVQSGAEVRVGRGRWRGLGREQLDPPGVRRRQRLLLILLPRAPPVRRRGLPGTGVRACRDRDEDEQGIHPGEAAIFALESEREANDLAATQ